MKKTFIIYLTFALLFSGNLVLAQTQTDTPSPSPTTVKTVEENEIQNLKEKVASKVAELRKLDQKAITGVVITVSGSGLTIKTLDEKIYQVKIDSALTKIYTITSGGQKRETKLSEVAKNWYIIVTGPVLGQTINTNYIYKDDLYLIKSGKITEVNKTDYYIKVLSTEKDSYTLDIESSTQQLMLNIKTLDLERIGFSKLKEGDTVHFIAKKTDDSKEVNRYSPQKILLIPQEYFMK